MENEADKVDIEKPDAWWYKIYAAVVVTTVVVITGLWLLSQYFSS